MLFYDFLVVYLISKDFCCSSTVYLFNFGHVEGDYNILHVIVVSSSMYIYIYSISKPDHRDQVVFISLCF